MKTIEYVREGLAPTLTKTPSTFAMAVAGFMTGEVLGWTTLRGMSPTCFLTALFNALWPATLTRTLEVLALLTLHPLSENNGEGGD